jgi:hypothetical protein
VRGTDAPAPKFLYTRRVKELHTEITIAASAERVWQVLTDFAAYPTWNPLVPKASGELREGARLRLRLAIGARSIGIKPRLLRVVPNRELAWRGAAPIPSLFRGEHVFEIEPTATGVRFKQWERFSGILVPLLGKLIDGGTRRGFEAMNVALKRRAEAS